RIGPSMLTAEDQKKYGSWTSQPVPAVRVRSSLPHLPHCSIGPSPGTRRTLFPWFVKIQDDEEHLEMIEAGTWSSNAAHYRDLTAPEATAIGNHHRHAYTDYRWPASVPLHGLRPISDALVGRRRWTDPIIIRDRNILLRSDRTAFEALIEAWRKNAVARFKEVWEVMVAEEIRSFGYKFFFVSR